MGYAGFWKRVAVAIIDGIIIMIGGFAIGFVFGLVMVAGGTHDPAVLKGMSTILGLILGWIYFAVMESSPTQGTLGKMAMGIKVTDLKGSKIDFGKATGRYFGKTISALILLIGFIMVAFTQKKQGLHDMMAGCLVVNRWPETATSDDDAKGKMPWDAEINKTRIIATVVFVVLLIAAFIAAYIQGYLKGSLLFENIGYMIGFTSVPLIAYIVYMIYPKHNGAKYVYYSIAVFFIIIFVLSTLHELEQRQSQQLKDPRAGNDSDFDKLPPFSMNNTTPAPALTSISPEQEHFDRIKRVHPDFEKYRDNGSLKKWIEKQPANFREEMQRVYKEGEADDVIDLFTRFKKDNNSPTVEAPVPIPAPVTNVPSVKEEHPLLKKYNGDHYAALRDPKLLTDEQFKDFVKKYGSQVPGIGYMEGTDPKTGKKTIKRMAENPANKPQEPLTIGQAEALARMIQAQGVNALRQKHTLSPRLALSGCDSGHWVDSVSSDGQIVKLEDGSIWEVDSVDAIDSMLWLPTTDIIACDDKLINTDDNEKVAAHRIR